MSRNHVSRCPRASIERLEPRQHLDATTDGPHRAYGDYYNSQFGGGGYTQQIVATSDPDIWYSRGDVGGIHRSKDGGATWNAIHNTMSLSSGDPYGVRGISVHPNRPNELVVVTGQGDIATGGLWRTTNGGQSWTFERPMDIFGDGGSGQSGRQHGYVLERNPSNPNVIFAGGFGESYRSADGGLNWQRVGSLDGEVVSDVDWDPRVAGRVWVASKDVDAWFIAISNQTMFTATSDSFRSTDGGLTFTQYGGEAPDEMVFSRTTPQRVIGIFDTDTIRSGWVDDVAGGNIYWDANPLTGSNVNGNGGSWASPTRSFALAAAPACTLMADGKGNVFKLDGGWDWSFESVSNVGVDRGADWWGPDYNFGSAASSLTVNPHDPRQWFLTDWFSVWRGTTNAAASSVSWTNSVDGIEGTMVHNVVQDPNNSSILYMAMADVGLARSTDGGRSFSSVEFSTAYNIAAVDIAVSRAAPDTVFVLGDDDFAGAHNSGSMIARSTNNGASFAKRAARGLPSGIGTTRYINTLAAHPSKADEIYVVVSGTVNSGGGVYRSANGGNDFASVSTGLPGWLDFADNPWNHNRNIAVGKDGSMLTFGQNYQNGLYRYEPANGTWYWAREFNDAIEHVEAVTVRNDDFYVAADTDGTWRTGDGGETFSKRDGARSVYVSVDPNAATWVILGTRDGLRRSTDSGGSFSGTGASLAFRRDVRATIRSGRIAVATDGNGVFVSGLAPLIYAAPGGGRSLFADRPILPDDDAPELVQATR